MRKGHLLGWYRNFLTGRTQRVVFGGAHLEPNGSGNARECARPVLIQHLCCRLAEKLEAVYADYCTRSKEIKNAKDKRELQEDLNI
jgi:hypothetical protein